MFKQMKRKRITTVCEKERRELHESERAKQKGDRQSKRRNFF